MNYRFVQVGNKIIAISSYAGKTVRGVAKCDPRDAMDEEYGMKLASLRCAQKVAKKRIARAQREVEKSAAAVTKAKQRYQAMQRYLCDAENALTTTQKELNKTLGQ